MVSVKRRGAELTAQSGRSLNGSLRENCPRLLNEPDTQAPRSPQPGGLSDLRRISPPTHASHPSRFCDLRVRTKAGNSSWQPGGTLFSGVTPESSTEPQPCVRAHAAHEDVGKGPHLQGVYHLIAGEETHLRMTAGQHRACQRP